ARPRPGADRPRSWLRRGRAPLARRPGLAAALTSVRARFHAGKGMESTAMTFEIIDADGHVTETWEQIARHLDEPYCKRPLLTPLFPQDGWDRRLMGTKGNWAGDGKSWLDALDAGGMAMAVLYTTVGLV